MKVRISEAAELHYRESSIEHLCLKLNPLGLLIQNERNTDPPKTQNMAVYESQRQEKGPGRSLEDVFLRNHRRAFLDGDICRRLARFDLL